MPAAVACFPLLSGSDGCLDSDAGKTKDATQGAPLDPESPQGALPSDLGHAAGEDLVETVAVSKQQVVFDKTALHGPFGTMESPVLVPSNKEMRLVGCLGIFAYAAAVPASYVWLRHRYCAWTLPFHPMQATLTYQSTNPGTVCYGSRYTAVGSTSALAAVKCSRWWASRLMTAVITK